MAAQVEGAKAAVAIANPQLTFVSGVAMIILMLVVVQPEEQSADKAFDAIPALTRREIPRPEHTIPIQGSWLNAPKSIVVQTSGRLSPIGYADHCPGLDAEHFRQVHSAI